MGNKILFLPAFRIIAEMTVYAVADIDCFSDINYFSLCIVKIIDTGSRWQYLKMLFGNIGWQALLFWISQQAFRNKIFFIIFPEFAENFYCRFSIATGTMKAIGPM